MLLNYLLTENKAQVVINQIKVITLMQTSKSELKVK